MWYTCAAINFSFLTSESLPVTPAVMIAALFAGRVLLGMGRSVAEAAERAFVADLCDKVPAVEYWLPSRLLRGLGWS